jgi:hypothetical protein
MKLKRTFGFLRAGALVLTPVYLFIVIAHLVLIPQSTATIGINHTSLFRRKTENYINLHGIDKVILNENNILNTIRNKSFSFILLLIRGQILPSKFVASDSFSQLLADRHHSYLSNRVIKI